MRISCARCLCQELCIRILYDHLCKISDLLSKISLSRSRHQDLCRTTRRSPSRSHSQTQLYQHSAMDTHDLRKGLQFEIKQRNFTSISRNFTSIPCDRHARSPQRVALRNQQNATLAAFRVLDTHDLRKGFIRNHASEALRLPGNHEPRSYEMMHWPRKSILKLNFQKCNPSQALRPQNMGSMVRILCARHVKRNPWNDARLPTFWQRPRNTAPATILITCPTPCAGHVDSSTAQDFLAPAMQNEVHVRKHT